MTVLEKFFYDHAGFGYGPLRETKEQGHIRCARELAATYIEFAASTDAYVSWKIDPEITSHDWENINNPKRPTLVATLYYSGEIVGSLSGVDVKDCNDPYCKVVEAELWQEFAAQRETCLVRGEN